jgi:hypothetical protein
MKVVKYGYEFEAGTPLWVIHATCYRFSDNLKDQIFHFKGITSELWGDTNEDAQFVWHPWADKMLEESLTNKYVALCGSGSSGKSAFMAIWMLVNYIADPFNTLCVCTSTSIEGAKMRIWAAVQKYYNSIIGVSGVEAFSSIVSHPAPRIYTIINGNKAEDRGVALIASEQGAEGKKSGKMRGFKVGEMDANANPRRGRFFLCLDEATDIHPTVLKTALSNLVKNPSFHALAAGNPVSYFDSFGVFCKPVDGWDTISVESERWETAIGGVALHFDSLKHPNYVLKENVWPLESWEVIDDAINKLDPNSLEFWRDFRGFWPPAGSVNTIYTEADLVSYGALKDYVEWENEDAVEIFAGVDPSFTEGGDRCAVVIVKCGKDRDGKWMIKVESVHSVYPDSTQKEKPHDVAVAEKVYAICNAYEVATKNTAIDTSGGGSAWGSVYSIVTGKMDWVKVNFSGAATDRPVSSTDFTKSKDKYSNRVSEIWFSGKELLRNRQFAGVTPELSFEMTNRKYETSRSSGVNTKIRVEPKKEMKKRLNNKSPDLADAFFIALDAIRSYIPIRYAPRKSSGKSDFRRAVERRNVNILSNNLKPRYESTFN